MNDSFARSEQAGWHKKNTLARQSSWIGDLIAGARPLFAKPVAVAAIPHGFLRCAGVVPQVHLVGDQFAVAPTFTGDGMAIARNAG